MARDMLEEVRLREPATDPALNPLQEDASRRREFFCIGRVIGSIPAVNPCCRLIGVPEPLSIEVVGRTVLKVCLGGCDVLIGPFFGQSDWNFGHIQGWNGQRDWGFLRLQHSVTHRLELEGDMGHDAQKTEAAGCSVELSLVRDGLKSAVGIDLR